MTELFYLSDFNVFEYTAKVLEIRKDQQETIVVLDRTVLYPRGGGQDWDTGLIQSMNAKFVVDEVLIDQTGTVLHKGRGEATVGDAVTVVVDSERRAINTRLHSGGHVVDMAVSTAYPDWIPVKGAHYPHMSFVEYDSSQTPPTEDTFETIKNAVSNVMLQTFSNQARLVEHSELAKLCRHVPPNLPTNKPTRVVLYGDFGVPCGGTHVSNSQEIGKLEVTKVKIKKGITKVSYHIEGIN